MAVGGQVFLHNARLPNTPDANPKSDWSDPRQETLIPPSIDKHSFEQIAAFDSASALLHFLPLQRNASVSNRDLLGRCNPSSRICSAASCCPPTDRRHLLAAGLAVI